MTYSELKKFCSRDETRAPIMEPFIQNGYCYAVEGRMAIRLPVTECESEGHKLYRFSGLPGFVDPLVMERQHRTPPDAAVVFPGREWNTVPFILPELPPVLRVPCLFCEHMPEDFKGCEGCDGERSIEDIQPVQIGADSRVLFNLSYLHLVRSLHSVCHTMLMPDGDRVTAQLQFLFPGGEGILNGMRGLAHGQSLLQIEMLPSA